MLCRVFNRPVLVSVMMILTDTTCVPNALQSQPILQHMLRKVFYCPTLVSTDDGTDQHIQRVH